MSIVNRRNAVVGYLALQALKRARRNATVGYLAAQGVERTRAHRRGRRIFRFALYVGLGLVSLGILAALAGFWRRQASSPSGTTEGDAVEREAAAPGEAGAGDVESGALADDVPEAVESAPAT
jgi:hypothetical protein